jgi:hypothetical protein
MTKRLSLGLAVIAAAALIPTTATGIGEPTDGEIDIASAELAGSAVTGAVNVFGTVRCATAGPLILDVLLDQPSTGGLGGGGTFGYTCPQAGDLVKWAITATGGPWMVGDKVTIAAFAEGATMATDVEDHVLRWGR